MYCSFHTLILTHRAVGVSVQCMQGKLMILAYYFIAEITQMSGVLMMK